NSPVGIEITRKNLELLNVKANLYFGDVLNYPFDKKFDVVFSIGLIEHFNPPTEIIEKHINLTKEGGYTVIGIPNLKYSLYYFLQKLVNREVLKYHVLLDKNELQTLFDKQSIIACRYVGVFNLFLLNVEHNSFWYKIICYSQGIVEKILRLSRASRESHFFSPFIFVILKKENNKQR
ncbi:MAG: class I SAM-dependent methyltransferase, partial [Candidatus Helarchaeota archaeon]|nr:class I SAM-dependent methyltransferase [Candidatus Helarchaeota archaeon]